MMTYLEIVWSYLFPWLLILMVVIVLIGYMAQKRGIGLPLSEPYEIYDSKLKIDGSRYGGPVFLHNLKLDESRLVDLKHEKEYQPFLRMMGIGMPGYRSGWFKLKNGKNVLVHIVNSKNVILIPTSSDYSLLLSIDDPTRFISSLRSGTASKFKGKAA